ncbi:MAG: hypothetical protein PV358_06595 [Acidimicrobiales bacterium]|nr:hypothetical protein [Acidimicrobiales bacterium]
MDDERAWSVRESVREMEMAADRLDALADTAELMGDDDGATRFRAGAAHQRLCAMRLLDR